MVTLGVLLILSGPKYCHWFNLACRQYSVIIRPANEARFSLANEEIRKEWFWNGAQLNCSHMMSKSESCLKFGSIISWHSQILSTGASSFEIVILEESRNAGSELMEHVRVPDCTWTHTHTQTDRHATWHVSYSHHSHCWHTWYTIYRKVTYKKPSEMTLFTSPHTDSLTDFSFRS